MSKLNEFFDDMDGKFEARLRDHHIVSRTTRMREGEVTLANPVAVLEVKFNFNVLDRLQEPSFVAIERSTSKELTYLIYEIAALRPTHFQMLGMGISMPTVIRKEYLNTIESSWGTSDETWIDVIAVPTHYRMDINEGKAEFKRALLVPLVGSKAHLLSNNTVQRFLCIENGTSVGKLIGFEMPLTIDMENLVRYHTGIFGFTGSGKSNLTSYLIREALRNVDNLSVVIFDVSGEYSIHLLDLLSNTGMVYSTEDFKENEENFLNSQAIPETLETKVSNEILLKKVEGLFDQKRIQKLSLDIPAETSSINIGFIVFKLEESSESKTSGSFQARLAHDKIVSYFYYERGYDSSTNLEEIKEEDREELVTILTKMCESVHEKSGLRTDFQALIEHIKKIGETKTRTKGDETPKHMTPERMASLVLGKEPSLTVVYIPEPDRARQAVSRYINRLLLLKKTHGARKKVLVVLDEAQEFIPDRTSKEDYTDQCNKSVEALLRQGRKYRAHCWLSTQRVAHLNVNALQQLHSYFVSTLPRFYDRMVIADAFSLSYDMLEKTTELETGQWLFVSYKATRQKNVPAFVQTHNNEEILLKNLGIFS